MFLLFVVCTYIPISNRDIKTIDYWLRVLATPHSAQSSVPGVQSIIHTCRIQEDHGPISLTAVVVVLFYCLPLTSSSTTLSQYPCWSLDEQQQRDLCLLSSSARYHHQLCCIDTLRGYQLCYCLGRYQVPGIVIREDAAMGYRERGVARQGVEVRFSARLDGVSEGRSGDRFHQLRGGHEGQQWGKR